MSGAKPKNIGQIFFLFWVLIFLSLILVLLFYRSLLISLTLGLFFAYILAPLVNLAEAKIFKSRKWATLFVVVIVFGLLGTIIGSLIPFIYDEGLGLIKLIPQAVEGILTKIEPLKTLIVNKGLVRQSTLDRFLENMDVIDQLMLQVKTTANKVWNSTPKVLGGVVNFFLIPFITFFILKELNVIKSELRGFVPLSLQRDFSHYVQKVDSSLRSVIKGQVIVALCLALLYMMGFGIVGIKFGIGIGAIAGCFRVIPYLDVVVGIILSLIVIVSQGYGIGVTVSVGLVFLIVQIIDGMYITPRVIGERAGLHPGLVVLTLFAFADWFGFFGVIIAVPTVAILVVTVGFLKSFYRKSEFYLNAR